MRTISMEFASHALPMVCAHSGAFTKKMERKLCTIIGSSPDFSLLLCAESRSARRRRFFTLSIALLARTYAQGWMLKQLHLGDVTKDNEDMGDPSQKVLRSWIREKSVR